MIKVYYKKSCGSSRRALSWFKKYNIEIQEQRISEIKKEDLFQLLQQSSEGLKEIVKNPLMSCKEVKKALHYIEHLSLNEALDFLILNPNVLQTPIIMEGSNYFIGYNADEIRVFLPKEYRRHYHN
jgi:regulatory protein spx